MSLLDLTGLKIVAFKGWASARELKKKKPKIPCEYALTDDGETFIRFNTQDPHTYHDCNGDAVELDVIKDKEMYNHIVQYYYDSTVNSYWIR